MTRGYSYVKTYGDVPQFWVGFLQEIPKHGSHIHEKIPNSGSVFQGLPGFPILKIRCVFVAKSQKMGTFFAEKSLNIGAYFWKILPLNMGMSLELPAAYTRPILT